MNSSPSARLRPFRPQPFGRYTLLSHLATGGMGDIYLARLEGAQGFEKLCVIKKMLPQLAEDAEFVERFVGEARTLVRLSQGSIAQVLDMGLHEGEAYMALEYVDGKDLRKVAARARDRQMALPLTFSLYVVSRVLDALAYAHRKRDDEDKALNLVHRDISPQNILISYEGEVKVIDFGLAKSRLSAAKTNPSIILGKFLYMSPEQARHQPVDRRSDLYAVGLCLYELLTGKNPFDALPPGELMSAVANPRIPPLQEVEPRVPPAVAQLVMKALAPPPEERFQTAEEFRGRVLTCLLEADPTAGPESASRVMLELFSAEYQQERKLLAGLKEVPRLSGGEPARAPATATPTMELSAVVVNPPQSPLPAKTIRLDGPVEPQPLSFQPTPRSREGAPPRDDGETKPSVVVDEPTRPAVPIEALDAAARARLRPSPSEGTPSLHPTVEVRAEPAAPPVSRSDALTMELPSVTPGALAQPPASTDSGPSLPWEEEPEPPAAAPVLAPAPAPAPVSPPKLVPTLMPTPLEPARPAAPLEAERPSEPPLPALPSLPSLPPSPASVAPRAPALSAVPRRPSGSTRSTSAAASDAAPARAPESRSVLSEPSLAQRMAEWRSSAAPTIQVPTVSGPPQAPEPSKAAPVVSEDGEPPDALPTSEPESSEVPPVVQGEEEDTQPRYAMPGAGARESDTHPSVVLEDVEMQALRDEALPGAAVSPGPREVTPATGRAKAASRRSRQSSPGMSPASRAGARPSQRVASVRASAARPDAHEEGQEKGSRERLSLWVTLGVLVVLVVVAVVLVLVPAIREMGLRVRSSPAPGQVEPPSPRPAQLPVRSRNIFVPVESPGQAPGAPSSAPVEAKDAANEAPPEASPMEAPETALEPLELAPAPKPREVKPVVENPVVEQPETKGASARVNSRRKQPTELQREWRATHKAYTELTRIHPCEHDWVTLLCYKYDELKDDVRQAGDEEDAELLAQVKKLRGELTRRLKTARLAR